MHSFQTYSFVLLFLSSVFFSCIHPNDAILNNKNFETGNWLLVIDNKVENTLFVVNDRNILQSNPFGLILKPSAKCGGTTCDGFIELYEDGELVASQEFLSKSTVIESESLKAAYKKATTDCIRSFDINQFKQQWDSLIKREIYPTRQHVQPEGKDIICFYIY